MIISVLFLKKKSYNIQELKGQLCITLVEEEQEEQEEQPPEQPNELAICETVGH